MSFLLFEFAFGNQHCLLPFTFGPNHCSFFLLLSLDYRNFFCDFCLFYFCHFNNSHFFFFGGSLLFCNLLVRKFIGYTYGLFFFSGTATNCFKGLLALHVDFALGLNFCNLRLAHIFCNHCARFHLNG